MVQIVVDGAIPCTPAILVIEYVPFLYPEDYILVIVSSDPLFSSFKKIDNMTPRPPVSGPGTAAVNSSQRQTVSR